MKQQPLPSALFFRGANRLAWLCALVWCASSLCSEQEVDSLCSPAVGIDYTMCSTNRSKCGFQPYLGNATRYLQEEVEESAFNDSVNSSLTFYGGCVYGGGSSMANRFSLSCPGMVSWSIDGSVSFDCGTNQQVLAYFDDRNNHSIGYAVTQDTASYQHSFSDPWGIVPDLRLVGQDYAGNGTMSFDPSTTSGTRIREVTVTSSSCTTNTLSDSLFLLNYFASMTVDSATYQWRTNLAGYTPSRQTWTLTDEFSDALLDSLTTSDLASAKSACWTEDNWTTTKGYASREQTNLTLTLRAFRYRFSFKTEKDTTYQLSWKIRTLLPDGSEPPYTPVTEVIAGNGDVVYHQPQDVDPPAENYAIKVIDDVEVKILGCASCSGGDLLGTGEVGNRSVDLVVGLGRGLNGSGSGQLWVNEHLPSLALATPAVLRFAGDADQTQVLPGTNGWLQQVLAPQGLADIVVSNAFQYAINLYLTNQIVGTNAQGFYVLTNSPQVTWSLENPSGTTNDFSRLLIKETRGTKVYTNDFTWNTNNQAWDLVSGNGLRRETRQIAWDGPSLTQTETRTVYTGASGQPAFKERVRRKQFSWGFPVIERTVDPDGAALTVTHSYDTTGLLTTNTWSTGYWERFAYDAQRRLTTKTMCFLDGATPNRVEGRGYAPLDYSQDNGLTEPNAPRQIYETLGTYTYHHYFIIKPGEKVFIQALNVNSLYYDPNNLFTTNKYHTNGAFQGLLRSVVRPDKTFELHTYATNSVSRTETVLVGQPDAAYTDVLDGAKTIAVRNLFGFPVSETVIDIASGLTNSLVTYSEHDDYGRPQRADYPDGSFTLTSYDCCGIGSFTDREGLQTDYVYDDLKRKTAEVRYVAPPQYLVSSFGYDATGNLLWTARQGTNSAIVTNQVTAYDAGGRRTFTVDALNHTNGFAYSANGLTTTNTLPNGATRIETRYQDGSLKEISGSGAHPARYSYGLEFTSPTYGSYTLEVRPDSGGGTNEWTRTEVDMAGRPFRTFYASTNTSLANAPKLTRTYYLSGQSAGQLRHEDDPDAVVSLFQYNARGELEYSAIDDAPNAQIDFAGTDRITRRTNDVVASQGTLVRRTRTYVWPTASSATSNLLSTVEESVDGTRRWDTLWNGGTVVTRWSATSYAGDGVRYTTNAAPDGSYSVSLSIRGRLSSVTQYSSDATQLGQTTYGYDEFNRVKTVTDARNGTTAYSYDSADRPTSVTTPAPGNAQRPQTTTTYYDCLGRATNVAYADGTSLTSEYWPGGELKRTFGSRAYPVGYGYDAQGRMTSMTNWTDFASSAGPRVSTWQYDAYRGFLTNKLYDGGAAGLNFTYTKAGRLLTRTGGRGLTATNAYSYQGDLVTVKYPASTVGLTNTYDRLGRLQTIKQAPMTTTRFYNDANEMTGESYAGGALAGLAATNVFDNYLRRTQTAAKNGSTTLSSASFGYDAASRLTNVTDGTYSAGYSYLANSPLVSQIAFAQSGTVKMTTSKQHDYLNRLLSVSSAPSTAGSLPLAFGYQYNDANQRTRRTESDGSFWQFGYDDLGQVTSGKRYWPDPAPVPGQQFEYGFDDIGNRVATQVGGDGSGGGLRSASYSVNSLNQYTQRDVPAAVDDLGIANVAATVTVNGVTADYRRGEYFQKLLTVTNSSAVWLAVTNIADLSGTKATNTGNVFVPTTPEAFGYDADGNLTNDGRWTLAWDAENRLVEMLSLTNAPADSKRWLRFTYDFLGRRIGKQTSVWTNAAWSVVTSNRFLYDGWNLVAELNATNNAVIRSFMWGLDMSGSEQGAGGVGGLLAVNIAGSGVQFAAFDGNANVAGLYSPGTATWSARYEYGPFAELIRASGPLARANPVRFSTKYQDDESDLLYHGYRYYAASTGRWLTRDPIGESGGKHLYRFVRNSSVSHIDPLGLFVSADPRDAQILADAWPGLPLLPSALLSVWDNLQLGGPLIQKVHNTMETRYFVDPVHGNPKYVQATAQANEKLRSLINKKVCGRLGPQDELLRFLVEPEDAQYYLSPFTMKQSFYERDFAIGFYEYRASSITASRSGSTVSWSATISIVDKMGFEDQYGRAIFGPWYDRVKDRELPRIQTGAQMLQHFQGRENFAHWMTLGVRVLTGGSREFLRGSYSISGEVDCCKQEGSQ